MSTNIIPPIRPFIRLYTLHQVETPAQFAPGDVAGWLIVRVRVETLRYVFAPLDSLALQPAYAHDPREGIMLARDAVTPRLQTLLDMRDPFGELGLFDEGALHWRRYAAARGLPAGPENLPITRRAARGLPFSLSAGPARRRVTVRLAQLQRALEFVQIAASTASTLASAWQQWQLGRDQHRLLDAQRALLQDAIQAQLAGQTRAFDRAQEGGFVRGYLADHAGDAGYRGLFGDADPGASEQTDP